MWTSRQLKSSVAVFTVNPPLRPPPPPHWEAYLFHAHLRAGGGGGLFNLEKMMVSVLHKELEYKVENLKYKKVGGHARIRIKSELPAGE